MTPTGVGDGEAAATSEGGAPPAKRLWWIPAIRGAIAVTLGVLVIAAGSHRSALVNFLGIYWLFSAVLTALLRCAFPGHRRGVIRMLCWIQMASVRSSNATRSRWQLGTSVAMS
jgi:uncharacterized membrane protein HdeD (DUF308 family)